VVASLRDSEFVRQVGERLIDTGLTGPALWPKEMQPTKRDEMALALGDSIRSIDGAVRMGGGGAPTTIRDADLDNIEKDAMALATGRAVMNMIGTAQDGLGAPTTIRDASMEDSLRDSAFVRRLGEQFQASIVDGTMAPWMRPDERDALTSQLRASEFQRKIGESLVGLTT